MFRPLFAGYNVAAECDPIIDQAVAEATDLVSTVAAIPMLVDNAYSAAAPSSESMRELICSA